MNDQTGASRDAAVKRPEDENLGVTANLDVTAKCDVATSLDLNIPRGFSLLLAVA